MGKLCKTDLSKKGSGNLGTTNALRVLGFKAGAVTFIGDILKGVVSFIIEMCIRDSPYPLRLLCRKRAFLFPWG